MIIKITEILTTSYLYDKYLAYRGFSLVEEEYDEYLSDFADVLDEILSDPKESYNSIVDIFQKIDELL